MKNILTKIAYSLIVVSLSVGYIAVDMIFAAPVSGSDAHSCTGSTGNLYGYIDTENVGPIYLSTESWNNYNPGNTTTTNFSVNYDRQLGLWSGRGWNKKAGWVDFSYDQISDSVRFLLAGDDYDNGITYTWGNWNGIADLSSVVYSNQNGSFQGAGIDAHNDTGGIITSSEDDYIGSGEWTFGHVEFQDPACPQNVNLFLNGTSRLHKSTCNISSPLIQWATENVRDCTATAGLWTLNTVRSTQNTGTSVHANSAITDSNTPVLFKLSCTGEIDDQPVEGIAIASCGSLPECDDPNDPTCPFNMISPVLIEA